MTKKRGRPKKQRPMRGDPTTPDMSLRDLAICLGTDRRELSKWILIANIPEDQFEQALESEEPMQAIDALVLLERRRTRKKTDYLRRCPHCHMPLRIEDVR
jgi:hypothetical protein